jgi:hypothetical protein
MILDLEDDGQETQSRKRVKKPRLTDSTAFLQAGDSPFDAVLPAGESVKKLTHNEKRFLLSLISLLFFVVVEIMILLIN